MGRDDAKELAEGTYMCCLATGAIPAIPEYL
jgi:hypothetical protein